MSPVAHASACVLLILMLQINAKSKPKAHKLKHVLLKTKGGLILQGRLFYFDFSCLT
jgi:hypothetical protein